MKNYLLLFLAIGLVFNACKKNDDEPFVKPIAQQPEPDPDPEPEPEPEPDPELASDYPVQDFMWQTMNAYYFWQGDVPDLADSRFTGPEDPDYVAFLKSSSNPQDFYYDKLLFMDDRFSFLAEDYRDLVNGFAGIFKSNGMEFGLGGYTNSNDLFGFVRYIIPNSNASTKDLKRGDIFVGVDGQALTANNYIELLFGDNDTYTLDMADIENNTIAPNGITISLTKEENLVEDPVLVANTLDISGQKIGYLMYNQFVGGSGEQLNNIFADFKANGVSDLVLDLRYNPGGLGSTATILASLIYGTNTTELFYRNRFNDKIQPNLSPANTDTYFVETTGTGFGNSGSMLNSLNLTKVYILATNGSVSASELVMNGLVPYIDVVHIGTATRGKNQGSFTFVDDPENNNFYSPDRVDQINPDNQWAIQPIVIFVENADGFSDYTNGLMPQIELPEDVANLGVLGDVNEPLLARAIQEITGLSAKRSFDVQFPLIPVANSKMFTPLRENLVLDPNGKSLPNPFTPVTNEN